MAAGYHMVIHKDGILAPEVSPRGDRLRERRGGVCNACGRAGVCVSVGVVVCLFVCVSVCV